MPVIKEWTLELNADHILRAQGAEPAAIRARKPGLVEIAEWALQEGRPLMQPTVLFQEIRVQGLKHERLELENPENPEIRRGLTGSLIAQHLGPAEHIVVLVCTIGETLENIAAELMTTDPLLGWAMDGLGSAATESLATMACNQIEASAAEAGKQTTLPLSPGMIGWPVDRGQEQIFALLGDKPAQIGIKINSSSMMTPRKSLSMVLGVGTNVGNTGRTCDYCSVSSTCKYQNHYA
jgi:hypothetical protein